MQGYTYFFPIAYSATDVAVYQQDVVIHRSGGVSYEEMVGGLKVWHVYVGDRCKSDYGDVRFTDAAGAALAYYLWPDYDSSSARFTVRLSDADSSGRLLVWYGAPAATTTSDPDATYDLWCDFLDAGEVAAVFDVVGTPDTTYADSVATITCDAREYYQSKKTFSRPARVEFRMADTGYGADQYPSATGFGVRNQGGGGYHVLREAMTGARYGLRSCNGGATENSGQFVHDLTFQKYRIDWASGTSATLLKNDAVLASVSTQIPTGPLPVTFGRFHYVYSGNQMRIDWILVRAYSATPPAAIAFGPEQEVVTPSDVYLVYDAAPAPLTLAGYADAYDYLSWTRRYRRPGAWKAQINRYLPAAKEFIPGRVVHFKRNGEDRLGLIETRQISVDTSGRPSEQWTVAGREIIGILGDRLCLHGVSTGTGYDEQTGAAETVMRHYVDANAINPADLARIVPFLALAPTDDGRGGTTSQKARFDVLADLLESICAASGLGYRGRWSWDDRRLYFEVIEGVDRSGSVKLSPALGNCTIKGYHESTNLAPSVAVVAGQGEAAARVVVDVGTGDGLIGLARRERFVDARDLATEAELEQRGAEKLAEDGDTTTLEVEYIRTASYRYGEDFDLGDIVHVEYPDIAAMDARIVAITEEYTREGERLTLTLGTEWPDLVSLLRTQRKDNAEKRI